MFENDHPIDIVGKESVEIFQLLWTREGGSVDHVEEACMRALQAGLGFHHEIKNAEKATKELNRKRCNKRLHREASSSTCTVS